MESVGMFSSIQRAVAPSGQTARARTAPVHPDILPRLDEITKRSHFPVAAMPYTRLARTPLSRLHHRNPLRHRGQRREVGVRRALIPVPGGVEVIAAIVGVTVDRKSTRLNS